MQSFLLGVWYFAVTRSEGNIFGKETINLWCPSTGGGKREYKGNLANLITRDIKLTYCDPFGESVDAGIVDDYLLDEPVTNDEPRREQSTEKEPAASNFTQQVTNNNPTFFNFNVTGNNNSFINKVDTVIIKNGGRKDE